MIEKDIMTLEQAPWVKYLEIDEKTGKRLLRKDTPFRIRMKYKKYLKQISKKRNTFK